MADPRTAFSEPPRSERPASTPDNLFESMRDYAVLQLVRAARELAYLHMDRAGRIVQGKAHPICDRCRAVLVDKDDVWGHHRGCAVGRVLGFAHELAALPPSPARTLRTASGLFEGLSAGSEAIAALRAELSGEACSLPGCACAAPDCPCDRTTGCEGGAR